MTPLLTTLLALAAGYLLGSIPSGYLAGRWIQGVDIRSLGSGSTAAGLAALAGHSWSLWLGGKGGKAVATGLGMLLGLVPAVGLACFGIFLTTLSASRIVSLSSVVAALSLPLLMLGSFAAAGGGLRPAYLVLALLTTLLVVWRHRSNLQRLLAGTEPKLGQAKSPAEGG